MDCDQVGRQQARVRDNNRSWSHEKWLQDSVWHPTSPLLRVSFFSQLHGNGQKHESTRIDLDSVSEPLPEEDYTQAYVGRYLYRDYDALFNQFKCMQWWNYTSVIIKTNFIRNTPVWNPFTHSIIQSRVLVNEAEVPGASIEMNKGWTKCWQISLVTIIGYCGEVYVMCTNYSITDLAW